MILSLEEARAYARDYDSPDEDILALIDVVDGMIEDGVQAGFDRSDPKAKMLAKLYVADLTDNRSVSESQAGSIRELVSSLKMQLRYKPVPDSGTGAG